MLSVTGLWMWNENFFSIYHIICSTRFFILFLSLYRSYRRAYKHNFCFYFIFLRRHSDKNENVLLWDNWITNFIFFYLHWIWFFLFGLWNKKTDSIVKIMFIHKRAPYSYYRIVMIFLRIHCYILSCLLTE